MSDQTNPSTKDWKNPVFTFTELRPLPCDREKILLDIWVRGAWNEVAEVKAVWDKVSKSLAPTPVPKSD